jgi:hypothetical protein
VDFIVVIGVFAVFFWGLVLAVQGFVGGEPVNAEAFLIGRADPDHSGIVHPPERHPVRLFLIGVGVMILAVLLGAAWFALAGG